VLLLLAAAAWAGPAAEVGRARKLLDEDEPIQRLRGIAILKKIDTRGSLRVLESAVRATVDDLDDLGDELDKLDDLILRYNDRLWRYKLARNYEAHNELVPKFNALVRRYNGLAARAERLFRVIAPATAALGAYRSPETREEIDDGATGERHPLLRQAFIAACGNRPDGSGVPALLEVLEERDPRARAAAVRALAPHAGVSGVADAVAALADDEAWQVRLAVYELMARTPTKRAIPFLAAAAAREDGEIAVAIDDYLYQLTGQSYRDAPESWTGWLKKHADAIADGTYAPPAVKEKPGGKTVTSFFTIPIESKRIMFVVDVSGSMSESDLRPREAVTRGIMEKHELGPTRMSIAKAEVIRAVAGLPEDAVFGVVVYSDYAKRMSRRLIPANDAAKRRTVRWLKKVDMGELTNIYEALRTSFGDPLARSGGARRFEDMPDTIVFLTDGTATRGRLSSRQTLLEAASLWNPAAGVAVHCVGIGKDHDRQLLRRLASANNGYYVDILAGKRVPQQRRRTVPGLAPPEPKAAEPEPDAAADLAHEDWEKRLAAAKRIEDMGEKGAIHIPALVARLDDEDVDVQEAVEHALLSFGERSVPPLAAAVKGPNLHAAVAAARVLQRLGDRARPAVPALVEALGSKEWSVQFAVARTLGAVATPGDESVIKALSIAAGAGATVDVQRAARKALERIRAR